LENNLAIKTKSWIVKKRKLLYAVVPYTIFLLAYLFLPLITGKNFYQMAGYNQAVSISVDSGDSTLYASRLLTYKETSPTAAQPGDRAVFLSNINGKTLTVDGTITSVFTEQHYFVVESTDGVSNNIYAADFIGSYVRVSTILDRFMYLNFKFTGRLLLGANFTVLAYFIFYISKKKNTIRQ